MDDSQVTGLLTLIGAVVTLGAGYARLFGGRQTQIVSWVIEGFRVKSRWRGLVNLGVGMGIAGALSSYAAWQTGQWGMLVAGVLAGLLASDEASKVHDADKAKETAQATKVEAARAEPDAPPVRPVAPLPPRKGLMG